MTETSIQKLLRTGKFTNVYKHNVQNPELGGNIRNEQQNPQTGGTERAEEDNNYLITNSSNNPVRREEYTAPQLTSGQPPAKLSAVPGKSGSSEVFRTNFPAMPNPAEQQDEEEELEALQATYQAIGGLIEKRFGKFYPTETAYCKAELRKMIFSEW